ncbi:MAG: chorismate lyase [Gammaproteobacteria bacterium]|nr:chorismate lyase [Gammaproteobacteria bacterium]
MRRNDNNNYRRVFWCNRQQLGHQPDNPDLRSLLFAPGSLTRLLERRCGEPLDLRIIAQQWRRPWQEEQQLLALAQGRYTLIREVSMACRGVPWLYARTLLPPKALRGAARRFTTIGQRPLGALLFGAPGRLSDPAGTARLCPPAGGQQDPPTHHCFAAGCRRGWIMGAAQSVPDPLDAICDY